MSCQTQELRLFDPLGSGGPDAATGLPPEVLPPEVLPGAVTRPDAGTQPRAADASAVLDDTPPAALVQPDCEPASAACRSCVAARSCAAPNVCHPSSGNCVAACPEDTSECPIGGGPLCSPTYRVCVWCLRDADCGGNTPACDVAAGVCVECLSDQHCALGGNPALPHCNVAAQSCRQCVVNADCGPGLGCEVTEGHCDDASDDSGGSGGSSD